MQKEEMNKNTCSKDMQHDFFFFSFDRRCNM